MNNFEISIAGISDVDSVASMFDLYRQFYEKEPNLKLASEYIEQRILRNESIIFLARNGSGIGLGFCQVYPTFCSVEARPVYTLYDLFVRPDARSMGVGRELLIAVEAHAKSNNIAHINLSTAKSNISAQALYESLGWVRDKDFYTYSRCVGG